MKDFIIDFEDRVRKTIKDYSLLEKKGKILIALSGGKDSAVCLHLFKKIGYDPEAIHINLRLGDYSEKCQKASQELCKQESVKLHLLDIKDEFGMRMCNLRAAVQEKMKVNNCLICGVIKKSLMNKYARKFKADCIVTGHNLDDEAQTVIMNFLQGNLMLGINSGPKTSRLADKMLVPRIKPLFFSPEEEIRKYARLKGLPIVETKCPCAINSLRIRTREFVNTLNNKEKERTALNYLSMIKNIPSSLSKNIEHCKICGEPARNEICKKCQILSVCNKK